MAVSVIFWTTVNAFDTPSDERVLQAPNGASRDRHQCVLAGHLARALDRTRWLPQTTCANCAGRLGDFLPPSPPAEQAPTSQDQTGQTRTDVGNGHCDAPTGNCPAAPTKGTSKVCELAPRTESGRDRGSSSFPGVGGSPEGLRNPARSQPACLGGHHSFRLRGTRRAGGGEKLVNERGRQLRRPYLAHSPALAC